MKRLLVVTLLALAVLAAAAIPAAAKPPAGVDVEADLDAVLSVDDYDVRFDKIDEYAFEDVCGIVTVQLSVGNNNVLQSVTGLSVAKAGDDLLAMSASVTGVVDPEGFQLWGSWDDYDTRFDKITDNAFMNACGVITVQMSSGNGNVLQAGVDIVVDPVVFLP